MEMLKVLSIDVSKLKIISINSVEEGVQRIVEINPDVIQVYKSLFFFQVIELSSLTSKKLLIFHSNLPGDNFFLVKEADHVVCVSKSVERLIGATIPAKIMTVIENGIEIFEVKKNQYQSIPRFVHVGRNDEAEKNLSELITFWKNRSSFLNGELHLFGFESEKNEGDIFYHAYDDKKNILSSASFLLSSSQNEGFGMSIAEALMAKVPVIARPCGGITDYLRKDVEIFFYSNFPEFDLLLKKIEQGFFDLKSVSNNGYRKVVDSFSINKMASKYLKLYLDII
jgi:glycosyltransferase involved in cell wall biosynthesis